MRSLTLTQLSERRQSLIELAESTYLFAARCSDQGNLSAASNAIERALDFEATAERIVRFTDSIDIWQPIIDAQQYPQEAKPKTVSLGVTVHPSGDFSVHRIVNKQTVAEQNNQEAPLGLSDRLISDDCDNPNNPLLFLELPKEVGG